MKRNKDQPTAQQNVTPAAHPLMLQLGKALKNDDVGRAGLILTELFRQFPARWREIWMMGSRLPQPGGTAASDCTRYHNYATFLTKAADWVVDSSEWARSSEMIEALAAGMFLNHLMKLNLTALPTLKHWTHSRKTRTLRVAAFLESQHYIAEDMLTKCSAESGFFNPEGMAHAEVKTLTGISSNLQTAIDSRVEATDLILRYDAHVYRDQDWGELDPATMVYADPDFHSLLILSELWRVHQDVWASVVYQRHGVTTIADSTVVIGPRNLEEFKRSAAGVYRSRDIDAGLIAIDLVASSIHSSDTSHRLKSIARSIDVPKAGEVWDAIVNTKALAEASSATAQSRHCWLELERLHFQPVIEDKLLVGPAGAAVEYLQWDRVLDTLRVLARAFAIAVRTQVSEPGGVEFLRTAHVVRVCDLVRVLCQSCVDVDASTVERCVHLLTFSAARKKLELWDQPLLPYGEGLLIFLPHLVISGNPCRVLENFIDEWRTSDFDRRGTAFEKEVAARLVGLKRMVVESKVFLRNGNQLEVDIVGVWEGKILLFECKCLKSVYSPADDFRAREALQYGVEQLKLRRRAILDDWNRLHDTVPAFKGVDRPQHESDVVCVVVTNLLGYSGSIEDDIVVVDEMILFRYFGDNQFTLNLATPANTLTIKGAVPLDVPLNRGLSDFIAYLRHPPQVQRVLDDMTTVDELIGVLPGEVRVKRTLPDYSAVKRLLTPEEIALWQKSGNST